MTQTPLLQNQLTFAVGPKFQRMWGPREAIVFALEGIGVTAFICFALLDNAIGMIGALGAVIAAVVLLFSHLGRPLAAWRVLLNVRRSWISRGSLTIGAFIILGALFLLAPMIPALSWLASFQRLHLAALLIAAGFILFYPGFAMQASAGIAFWSKTQPALSFFSGLASGLFIVMAASAPAPSTDLIIALSLGATLLTAILVTIHISTMRRLGGAAAVSAKALVGKEWLLFWLGAVGLGLILPAVVLVGALIPPGSLLFIPIAAGRIVGDVALRYAILKVGAFESPVQRRV